MLRFLVLSLSFFSITGFSMDAYVHCVGADGTVWPNTKALNEYLEQAQSEGYTIVSAPTVAMNTAVGGSSGRATGHSGPWYELSTQFSVAHQSVICVTLSKTTQNVTPPSPLKKTAPQQKK